MTKFNASAKYYSLKNRRIENTVSVKISGIVQPAVFSLR